MNVIKLVSEVFHQLSGVDCHKGLREENGVSCLKIPRDRADMNGIESEIFSKILLFLLNTCT